MIPFYQDEKITLWNDDCLSKLSELSENSFDTIITDPPYGLDFMGKDWDKGVPGQVYWKSILRVAKPGAFLLAFGGNRTHHRLMCSIEDSGWEMRDCMMWLYGSGYPKGMNLGKAISEEWEGWNTTLKPAWEPIILAMKPLDGGKFKTNAEKWKVAGLNVDACKVNHAEEADARWPTNVLLDEESAKQLDEQSGILSSGGYPEYSKTTKRACYGKFNPCKNECIGKFKSKGGASRFFYCGRASTAERGVDNEHPTVKPLELMRYLCKLTKTPTGGNVLDPFSGTASTLIAASLEGRNSVGIELDKRYCDISVNRIKIPRK